MNDIPIVVGYIMHYDLLKDTINGSFFSKIDKAIEIAEKFALTYNEGDAYWIENNFEDTIYEFVKKQL
jgi:hypothetical protein